MTLCFGGRRRWPHLRPDPSRSSNGDRRLETKPARAASRNCMNLADFPTRPVAISAVPAGYLPRDVLEGGGRLLGRPGRSGTRERKGIGDGEERLRKSRVRRRAGSRTPDQQKNGGVRVRSQSSVDLGRYLPRSRHVEERDRCVLPSLPRPPPLSCGAIERRRRSPSADGKPQATTQFGAKAKSSAHGPRRVAAAIEATARAVHGSARRPVLHLEFPPRHSRQGWAVYRRWAVFTLKARWTVPVA